ncbi:hypothetical protein CEXT_610681 [Caerostris extrusa]|uniref:Uncharacterized protein n=1 Tax=Caerostris extrusa TaxID=172846 RepID=A0AAV4N6C7_CAEEX|nr:hypothetical protein CEXT_610681 [Caerostris extrusa]
MENMEMVVVPVYIIQSTISRIEILPGGKKEPAGRHKDIPEKYEPIINFQRKGSLTEMFDRTALRHFCCFSCNQVSIDKVEVSPALTLTSMQDIFH